MNNNNTCTPINVIVHVALWRTWTVPNGQLFSSLASLNYLAKISYHNHRIVFKYEQVYTFAKRRHRHNNTTEISLHNIPKHANRNKEKTIQHLSPHVIKPIHRIIESSLLHYAATGAIKVTAPVMLRFVM